LRGRGFALVTVSNLFSGRHGGTAEGSLEPTPWGAVAREPDLLPRLKPAR
jgi:hypothetical protein